MQRLTKQQRFSLMIGLTWGDGCLYGRKNKGFSGGHSEPQLDYLKWKAEAIRVNFPVFIKIKKNVSLKKKNPRSNNFYQVWTTTHHSLTAIYKRLYDENNRKHITDWGLSYLDALGLAVLFMDDGCKETRLRSDGTRRIVSYKISLQSFTFPEACKFSDWLYSKYGIASKVYLQKHKFPDLKITTEENRSKFRDLVAPYVLPCMEYKLYV